MNEIKKDEFPKLWQACYLVWMDGGGTEEDLPEQTFGTELYNETHFAIAERALGKLTPEMFEEFVLTGADDEERNIFAEQIKTDSELALADEVLLKVMFG